MSNYGWVISSDLTSPSGDEGLTGPFDLHPEIQLRLAKGEGREFRLLDDDKKVYYLGKIVGSEGFEPLDDFGMPNAGCTIIQYRSSDRWETL